MDKLNYVVITRSTKSNTDQRCVIAIVLNHKNGTVPFRHIWKLRLPLLKKRAPLPHTLISCGTVRKRDNTPPLVDADPGGFGLDPRNFPALPLALRLLRGFHQWFPTLIGVAQIFFNLDDHVQALQLHSERCLHGALGTLKVQGLFRIIGPPLRA